ncbi:MAG TPA: maleylpyruvate isomerase N-terminal domain-containing protein [Gemmatimonadaceae bacterium]
MERITPIYTAELFPPLTARLVSLLRELPPAAWELPTLAGAWRVRDVAAHLLDGDLRRLSACRDGHALAPGTPITGWADLVAFINALNASGVEASRRLSPRVLTDLLEVAGRWVADYFAELPPHGPAAWAVAWAGEERSENWMDIGRDYTERWHHQMQIRDAVGAPGLLERRWLFPLLDLSVRALPRAYADVSAPDGTAVRLDVESDGADAGPLSWSLVREGEGWGVWRGAAPAPAVTVRLAADVAWRVLYNALPAGDAERAAHISGDSDFARPLFRTRSVMV